ncbi:protein of unknown function [Legionella hackeliae]|uniref:Uncharacterized protein n=1 Tax=Legionella hackeliae TaxID=449 RepID=A0A0A8UKE0_LEGHA|nr:protein of unknown function [Legionella hackeliae]
MAKWRVTPNTLETALVFSANSSGKPSKDNSRLNRCENTLLFTFRSMKKDFLSAFGADPSYPSILDTGKTVITYFFVNAKYFLCFLKQDLIYLKAILIWLPLQAIGRYSLKEIGLSWNLKLARKTCMDIKLKLTIYPYK